MAFKSRCWHVSTRQYSGWNAPCRAQVGVSMQHAAPDKSAPKGDRPDNRKVAAPGTPGQSPAGTAPNRELTAAAAAVIGGCLLVAAFLIDRNAPATDASAAGIAANHQTAPRIIAPSPTKWSYGTHSRWRTANPKNAVFELPAQNKVPVWMKHVRPMLVVRCLSKGTEAFVFIESAAAIESQDEDHTVRIAFDNEPTSVERWRSSSAWHMPGRCASVSPRTTRCPRKLTLKSPGSPR